MRKQLIIKVPKETTSKEISAITKMITDSYATGYPIFMFPDWEYEIVEISEPMLVMNSSRTTKEEFIEAMRNVQLNVCTD